MFLIALLAVAVAAGMRYGRCMERARCYGSKAELYRTHADTWHSWTGGRNVLAPGDLDLRPTDGPVVPIRNGFRDLAEKCERLRAGFERAAWLPFAPMPIELDREEFAVPGWTW